MDSAFYIITYKQHLSTHFKMLPTDFSFVGSLVLLHVIQIFLNNRLMN
jgi:hypothetical protein